MLRGPGSRRSPRKMWPHRYTKTRAMDRECPLVVLGLSTPEAGWHRRAAPLRFFVQMNFVGDAGGLVQHGGNRAVFFFRQADGIFHRFARDISSNAVLQFDASEYTWGIGSFLRLGADFHRGERLAFFLQDADHVISCTSAQRD